MTASVQQIINAFEGLSPTEKHEAAIEIIRRVAKTTTEDFPVEALHELTDLTFQELDAREAEDAGN